MLQAADSAPAASRRALATLLAGYEAALDWHRTALRFLLTEPWLPAGVPGPAISDLVRALPLEADGAVPTIRSRLLGYAQAFPHIRIPDRWVDSLVRPDNPNARDWLAHHGRAELLQVLRRLPAAFDTGTVVAQGGDEFRLTTVGQEAAVRETGFLEPADEIVIEPGLAPLLAVQTVVHEWIHILHEHARERAGQAWRIGSEGSARYQPVTPVLAEGLAEWEAERALAPVIARLPLLGLFEAEKRAAMAADAPDDPHLVGYRLVAGLAGRLGDAALVKVLARAADDPEALARDPVLRLPAQGHTGTRLHASPPSYSASTLVPETRFLVDDVFPEVIGVRLVVPIKGEREAGSRKR